MDSSTQQLLEETLAAVKHNMSAERTGAISSVKIELKRGTVDIAVHAYTGSDISEAEAEAVASYRRVLVKLNQDGVDAFARTLEDLKAR